jgi:hypothetical protein
MQLLRYACRGLARSRPELPYREPSRLAQIRYHDLKSGELSPWRFRLHCGFPGSDCSSTTTCTGGKPTISYVPEAIPIPASRNRAMISLLIASFISRIPESRVMNRRDISSQLSVSR